MKIKKISSIVLAIVLAFSISSAAFACTSGENAIKTVKKKVLFVNVVTEVDIYLKSEVCRYIVDGRATAGTALTEAGMSSPPELGIPLSLLGALIDLYVSYVPSKFDTMNKGKGVIIRIPAYVYVLGFVPSLAVNGITVVSQ